MSTKHNKIKLNIRVNAVKMKILLLAMLLPLVTQAADVMYVSDELRITLRTGQGNQHRIIKTLKSGTRLEVIERGDDGYVNVRAPDGTEGWALTQYLVSEPVARDKLAAAESKLAQAQTKLAELKQQLSQLQTERSKLEKNNAELESKSKELDKQVGHLKEVATRPIQLDKENKRLKEANVSLQNDLQLKNQENQVLKDKSDREWFVIGAAVLLGGIILGLIFPKLRLKKRTSWDL